MSKALKFHTGNPSEREKAGKEKENILGTAVSDCPEVFQEPNDRIDYNQYKNVRDSFQHSVVYNFEQ